jgi:hypothetical protein
MNVSGSPANQRYRAFLSHNGAEKASVEALVIQRLRELDPGSALEKTGQVALFGSLAAGQDYR